MFYSSIIPCLLFLWPESSCKYSYGALWNLLESAELIYNVFCFLTVCYPCKSGSQGGKMSLHIQLSILKMWMAQENTQKLQVLFLFFLFFWLFLIKSSFVFFPFHLLHLFVASDILCHENNISLKFPIFNGFLSKCMKIIL